MLMSSARRFLLKHAAQLCLLVGVGVLASIFSTAAIANIGDSLEQAKARVPVHVEKHGGRHPLFHTNESGVVVWECWEARPGGWTKPQAMSLVKDLIPAALKAQTPRRIKSKAGGEMLVYQDGTTVWLEFSGSKAVYRLAAVWVRDYRGSEC
jgi:hypothetical protein